MKHRFGHKLIIIVIWLLLSLGMYRCSTGESNTQKQVSVLQERASTQEDLREEQEEVPVGLTDGVIRVLIRNDSYAGCYHEKLTVSAQQGLYIEWKQQLYETTPQQEYELSASLLDGACMKIWAKEEGQIQCPYLVRNSQPSYRGALYCYGTDDGIVVVNELSLEEYLYGVVPSEMPMSYPTEALKAQAICARTYACYHGRTYAYPQWEAHVDDSTAYQVYRNIAEQPQAIAAVDATKGLIMTCQGEVIESFYYAASSGYSAGYEAWETDETADTSRTYLCVKELTNPDNDDTAWQVTSRNVITTAFSEQTYRDFIDQGRQNDIEFHMPWYRWYYEKTLDISLLWSRILTLFAESPDKVSVRNRADQQELPVQNLLSQQTISEIKVLRREASGMVTRLGLTTPEYEIRIDSQHAIRQVLASPQETIVRQDGTTYALGELLPSAFFYIEYIEYIDIEEKEKKGSNALQKIVLHGGGMGHGVGMSQNGAKGLAEQGYPAEEILQYYYKGIAIEDYFAID